MPLFLGGMRRWSCNMSYCFAHHVYRNQECVKKCSSYLRLFVPLFSKPVERKLVNLRQQCTHSCFSSTLSVQTLSCHQGSCPPRWPTSNPRLFWSSSRAKAAGKGQLCLIAIHVQCVLLKQSPSPHEEQHVYPSPIGLASSCGSQRCQYVLAGEY